MNKVLLYIPTTESRCGAFRITGDAVGVPAHMLLPQIRAG